MSDPKTNNPVPLWYKVTVSFSDGTEPVVECWEDKGIADRAEKAWREIEKLDGELYGQTYQITDITVTPQYSPAPNYIHPPPTD